jgi:hypothetical protein
MPAIVGTNSYVTVAEADAYMAAGYGFEAWANEANKDGALISAARALDMQCSWTGSKSDPNQDLAFPRKPDADPVPQDIKDAQCEIAFMVSSTGSTAQTSMSKGQLKSLKAQGDLEWYEAGGSFNPLVNTMVSSLLSQYGLCRGNGSTRIIPLKRQ